MHPLKWYYHPFLIFIFSVVALGTSLFLYIYWYMEASAGISDIAGKYNIDPRQVLEPRTWLVILILSILVGIILLGIFTIYVYNRKTFQLYRTQRNFINSFTHELKTPVTSLKLYLETFQKHALSRDDQLRYIGFMIHDVDRLSGNINHILDLARIESGNFGGKFAKMDVVVLIRRFVEDNRHLLNGCDIRIIDPPEGVRHVCRINAAMFEMLIMNLMTNAVKYNDAERPEIIVSFERRNRQLLISFADNGIGIHPNDLKKIFKKFYRGHARPRKTVRGSGIGLYLVQQIAVMHQGRIAARCIEDGRGAVFTLTLPCPQPEYRPLSEMSAAESGESRHGRIGKT